MKSLEPLTTRARQPTSGKHNRVTFLATILATIILLLTLLTWQGSRPPTKRVNTSSTLSVVEVIQPYTLTWEASGDTEALRMTLPVVDFGSWYRGEHYSIHETSDGPTTLQLMIPIPGPDATIGLAGAGCTADDLAVNRCVLDRGQLLLHRALPTRLFQERLAGMLGNGERQQTVETVWAREIKGSPEFLGFDCESASLGKAPLSDQSTCYRPGGIQRLFGGWWGLRRIPVKPEYSKCDRTFVFRGREVKIRSQFACTDPQSRVTFKAGMQMLQRLLAETTSPPTPAVVKARSQRAAETCLFLDGSLELLKKRKVMAQTAEERAAYLCGYAVQLLLERLRGAEDEAAPQIIKLIGLPSYRTSPWDRWYLEEVIHVLAKAPKPDLPTAIRAETLRFNRLAWGYKPEEIEAARQSLESLSRQVAALDTLDIDLFDNAVREIWGGNPDGRRNQAYDFLKAWYEKTRTITPESDVSLKIKYVTCQHMMYRNLDRSVLKECADALASAWQQRVESGRPLAFEKEAWLASAILEMHQSHTYETRDFAAGLEDVRSFRRFATQRIQDEAEGASLSEKFDKVESDFTAQISAVARKR